MLSAVAPTAFMYAGVRRSLRWSFQARREPMTVRRGRRVLPAKSSRALVAADRCAACAPWNDLADHEQRLLGDAARRALCHGDMRVLLSYCRASELSCIGRAGSRARTHIGQAS